ncbi:acetyltransferase [Cohnella xylanilytica]|uniref:acyltransferase n=1 Tax=Cohnella xylanilytica TaxID=557555 RepID=UPI001B11C9BB|nr:acyltransferase [Cohnella xylanilytica]GIO12252.1 acetyltransferase [Cohnella xylanilytica]
MKITQLRHSINKRIQKYLIGHRFKQMGKRTYIEEPSRLINKEHMSFGNNVLIRFGTRIECVSRFNDQMFEPDLIIGDNVNIEQNCHIVCASRIIVENDVQITGMVSIVDIIHPYENIELPIKNQNFECKPVYIEEGSFIGMGSRIMPGVRIGKHCTIGANSVVTKDVPSYSVAAGIPAKVVKIYNINDKKWMKV